MAIAVKKDHSGKPDLGCGICSEHGGDPQSFFLGQDIGLDYVTCSSFRIPFGRPADTRAALKEQVEGERRRK